MPRKSRIDTPGALHHIIARGIDSKNIFKDDKDRGDFLERLGAITVMRRLLTGSAVSFNRSHRRKGH